MKRLIPYITFVCLTASTTTSGLEAMAGGCSSHMNKRVEIKCAENDTECQIGESEMIELNKTLRS